MYGNYNFWSWLRYWYIDSCNLVTMLLIDKSYYDYDYEKPPEKVEVRRQKTDEEIREALVGFGFGHLRKSEKEIQSYILNQEGGK